MFELNRENFFSWVEAGDKIVFQHDKPTGTIVVWIARPASREPKTLDPDRQEMVINPAEFWEDEEEHPFRRWKFVSRLGFPAIAHHMMAMVSILMGSDLREKKHLNLYGDTPVAYNPPCGPDKWELNDQVQMIFAVTGRHE